MLLSKFDIIYVLQKAVKGPADNALPDYEPMHTFFPNEEVMFTTEEEEEEYPDVFSMEQLRNGVGAVLVSISLFQSNWSFHAPTTSLNMKLVSWVCKQPGIRDIEVYGDSVLIICQTVEDQVDSR